MDPEDLRQLVGEALAAVIAEVEGLGGTVTSVSGAGLVALFGAPEAHEDDPERAVRAGRRILSALAVGGYHPGTGTLSVRVGIETGPAVVGPSGPGAGYGAVGEVVGAAAALQSAAKAGSVLVGPVTRAATEKTFVWGPTEDVVPTPGAKPLVASYLERPEPRPPGYRGQRRMAGRAPLVGRQDELARLDGALREALSGTGSAVFLVGEPGLGKTRLVQECRKRFMAWVGAGTGRLPLWLEGRCASYASSTPYGLYQQLISRVGGGRPRGGRGGGTPRSGAGHEGHFRGPGRPRRLAGPHDGPTPSPQEAHLARLSPEGLQRATFAAVSAVVAQLAKRGPTVLVLEDLHWADPISLRLTEELAALAADGPVLLLATRRPEPDPGVSDLESALESNAPLPAAQRRALTPARRSRTGAGPVPNRPRSGRRRNRSDVRRRRGQPALLGRTAHLRWSRRGALVRDGTAWRFGGSAGTRGSRGVGASHPVAGRPARLAASGGHRFCLGPRAASSP